MSLCPLIVATVPINAAVPNVPIAPTVPIVATVPIDVTDCALRRRCAHTTFYLSQISVAIVLSSSQHFQEVAALL